MNVKKKKTRTFYANSNSKVAPQLLISSLHIFVNVFICISHINVYNNKTKPKQTKTQNVFAKIKTPINADKNKHGIYFIWRYIRHNHGDRGDFPHRLRCNIPTDNFQIKVFNLLKLDRLSPPHEPAADGCPIILASSPICINSVNNLARHPHYIPPLFFRAFKGASKGARGCDWLETVGGRQSSDR